jgi:hypothetical protein
MKKRTVWGLPLNPARLLNQLAGHSFCLSYFHRDKLGKQTEDAMRLVGQDEILMLDNGAFSAWRKGLTVDWGYWNQFLQWAIPIMDRCPQAVAVVPDVIAGEMAHNHDLAMEFTGSLCMDRGRVDLRDRLMVVWHLHEPIEYLTHMVEGGWNYIAFGSSGEFAKVGTHEWHGRVKQAFDALDVLCQPGSGYRRPWVHMMRAQAELSNYPFDSADSTNVAINHNNFRRRHPGEHHVARMANRIKVVVDAGVSGVERSGIESPASLAEFVRRTGEKRGVCPRPTQRRFSFMEGGSCLSTGIAVA